MSNNLIIYWFRSLFLIALMILSSSLFAGSFQNIFINEQNTSQYKNAVLEYLEDDFNNSHIPPENHFSHNKSSIEEAFSDCTAMVAVNDKNEIAGYMVWSAYDGGLKIEIIEVLKKYQQQGIFKNMIKDLSAKITDVFVLTASVLPQAESVYDHDGWKKISELYSLNGSNRRHLKIIQPVAKQLDALPDGHAIAIFSKGDATDSKEYIGYYEVKTNLDKYKMKYFQLDLDEHGKLSLPIVTEFHKDGYVGIYLDRELIAEGKIKNLLADLSYDNSLLVINKITPINPVLFRGKGFFLRRDILKKLLLYRHPAGAYFIFISQLSDFNQPG